MGTGADVGRPKRGKNGQERRAKKSFSTYALVVFTRQSASAVQTHQMHRINTSNYYINDRATYPGTVDGQSGGGKICHFTDACHGQLHCRLKLAEQFAPVFACLFQMKLIRRRANQSWCMLQRKEHSITGVTVLGADVNILRRDSCELEVYDTETFTLQRRLKFADSAAQCYGLASCNSNMCHYVSDYGNSRIYRIDINAGNAVTSWAVTKSPSGVSVTRSTNLLVTGYGENKLQEYTTRGSLVREISLQSVGRSNPWHAIQLSSDTFLVSYGDAVVSVTADGKVQSSYGSVKFPVGLVVDKHGSLIVADRMQQPPRGTGSVAISWSSTAIAS